MNKRTFLKNISAFSLAGFTPMESFARWMDDFAEIPNHQLAKEDDFWLGIRNGYRLKPDYINLENGYYCFMPQELLEIYLNHVREVNYQGAYYMRTVQFDNKKKNAARLADLAGCSSEELIITRNTTESLDIIIGGFHWKEGDEAVMAEQDYGAMLDMFKLVGKRFGVVNRIVSIPNNPTSDEELVQLYENAITPKTRLLMVCHMVNITGQIMPVRKIADMAHSKGVQVLVDGAHAFAHIQYKIPDLHCDYYAASLHKWLSVPLGAGILYVKRENIPTIWPLLADGEPDETKIGHLNHIGTHPVHTDLAIGNSIDFYFKLGSERKEARLRYLQNYWTSRVRGLTNIVLNTPADVKRSCGIANVGIKGMKPGDMAKILLEKYKVYTVAIDGANVHGCRITPNIYTTTQELDIFVKALKEMAIV